ncbi:multiple sugar transport system ATP-binding protein [Bosea sp. CRIB-10]|uniref:ABC transporter ATP-binding protein n=1 Tax=Bosea sp. CRIB-10 TaxID=378404 RepID=UPI0008E4DC08|nr:ABC transporter ATP-binding protein [Bosea sp. CRIB-10]SFB77964.1 multiple sugar transport system ATP-binding protein [Bosea sp. CRIB-10]
MAEIRVENLLKQFGSFTAVRDTSFTVQDGDFFCLLGPSGCGKTTTLRMVAGLELPSSGSIRLDGEDVTFKRARERDIAMVFQLFALYPHMNVRRNIAFPLVSVGTPKPEIRRRVEEAARMLRIEHLLDKPVSGLSGGDRQRVALGRALVRQPKAFMMDEPLGALDAEFRHIMCGELRAMHDRLKATTVYVTHDQLEAMSMANVIAVMNGGVVEQLGSPQDIYDRPASIFVAEFIGSPAMNLLRFEGAVEPNASELGLGGVPVAIPASREGRASGPLALGVRPEHVALVSEGGIRGKVVGTEYLGTTQIVTVGTAYGAVKARVSSAQTLSPDELVGLQLRSAKLSLFAGDTGKVIRSTLHEAPHAASRHRKTMNSPHAPGAAHV